MADVVDLLPVVVRSMFGAMQDFIANARQDAVEWELLSDPQILSSVYVVIAQRDTVADCC